MFKPQPLFAGAFFRLLETDQCAVRIPRRQIDEAGARSSHVPLTSVSNMPR